MRALLLYPMNALANDQMKRLREVLAGYPAHHLRALHGRHPGGPQRARELFGELNIGQPILPNELLSRTEMRATAPHLLLTNFAMLEYLLLRPRDMDLFATGEASKWRFLVVDEAHVYDGSQGAEIAMLLRRVRDRVASDRPLQCIATSATVGQDSDPGQSPVSPPTCSASPSSGPPSDPARQDLVVATRVALTAGALLGPDGRLDYTKLAASATTNRPCWPDALRTAGRRRATPAEALTHEGSLAGCARSLLMARRRSRSVVATCSGEEHRHAGPPSGGGPRQLPQAA